MAQMSNEDALEAKRLFYDELYALDESDGEERDQMVVASMAVLKNSQGASHVENSAPRKYQKRHTITGPATLAEQTTSAAPPASTAPPVLPEPPSKPIVSVPKKLFHGLIFYFFPPNDIAPARRMRIRKAIEHGATWTRDWTSKVSHIIVDRSMNYGQVMASLKLDKLPPNVALVDEVFPAECISYRVVLDPSQRQYHIKGYFPAQGDQAPSTIFGPSSAQSDTSLQLKPAGKAVTVREPQTPSAAESSSVNEPSMGTSHVPSSPVDQQASQEKQIQALENSELDDAISEAKRLQHMPLDFEDEETKSSSDEESSENEETEPLAKKLKRGSTGWQEKFQCMQPHTGKNDDNPNAQTIALLQQMADYYTEIRDQWRPISYRKVIAQLRNHPTRITTKEQAIKLPFVGKRLAEKIEEIAHTNHLRRLENARQEPTDQSIQAFIKIYGVGFAQASRWVSQGHRTLADLVSKATLSENQKIGIAHYDDFNARIPRAEVKQHADLVRCVALSLDKDLEIHLMGSYRRGAETSGDVDLIFTHASLPLAEIRALVLDTLVPRLFKQGFLKATLAASSHGDGSKWHGASCLPDSSTWRRIDFLLVPREELGAALIYFTGNDIFNRSLRLLAGRKGMRLNQRGLYKDVMRGAGRVKVTEGVLVEGADEKKIFAALGVPWRPPEHRIC